MNRNYYFYLLMAISIISIFFTHPFMRYPYDIWEHLFTMDSEYINLVNMPENRKVWHLFWSTVFELFGIENSQIILRAYIIHISQTLFALSSIFIFSRVVSRVVLAPADTLSLNYIAYWSTAIWITIFATFSVYYHHIWIMWYSVNYQITLPLFWYSLALATTLIFFDYSYRVKIFLLSLLIIILYLIFTIHPMELLYFIIYFVITIIIYFDKLFSYIKRYYLYLILAISLISFAIKESYSDSVPLIAGYLSVERLPLLYDLIVKNGKLLVDDQCNRAFASFNELMVLSLIVGLIALLVMFYRKRETIINVRVYLLLFVTSLIVLLPLFEFTAGVASVLSNLNVVNRFYYSASIFLLLPISVYYLLHIITKQTNIKLFNFSIIVILLATTLYSRNFTEKKNYYKNVKSLESSFSLKKVGFHLSDAEIRRIGELLAEYESSVEPDKSIYYLAKGDIAMVLKYIYRRDVYWRGRNTNPTYIDMEDYIRIHKPMNKDVEYIIFRTPNDFPVYEPYR